MTTHMTKTWFVDGQIIEEPIPEAEMNTNRSGNLHEVMHQAAWDSATRVPEGDIRALKHRIHELEGEVVGYKQILDTQPEPAECDGGQCGIGGYCKDCPKTKPELKIINMENFVGSGKPLVPVCWMNANDIDKTDWKVWAHGKPTVSMPLFTVPPQREWVGLTDEELLDIADMAYVNDLELLQTLQIKLKEKNTWQP